MKPFFQVGSAVIATLLAAASVARTGKTLRIRRRRPKNLRPSTPPDRPHPHLRQLFPRHFSPTIPTWTRKPLCPMKVPSCASATPIRNSSPLPKRYSELKKYPETVDFALSGAHHVRLRRLPVQRRRRRGGNLLARGAFTEAKALELARIYLHDNAARLYGEMK